MQLKQQKNKFSILKTFPKEENFLVVTNTDSWGPLHTRELQHVNDETSLSILY